MKATIIILTAILSLQINFLFADKYESANSRLTETSSATLVKVLPVISIGDEFSDILLIPKEEALKFAPVTPKEADFSDNEDATEINPRNLLPVTPAEADFE